MENDASNLVFENHWKSGNAVARAEVLKFWKHYAIGLEEQRMLQRLDQLVYVVRRERDGKVVAESTAEKVFIRQLKNNLYNTRMMIGRDANVSPGLLARLVTDTFQFLESIHRTDGTPRAIGVITLIESEGLKRVLRKAILSPSGLVFIGNSPRGHQIRVRYFTDALIN